MVEVAIARGHSRRAIATGWAALQPALTLDGKKMIMAASALSRRLIPVGALLASAALVVVAAAPAQAAGTNLVTNGNFASPVVSAGGSLVTSSVPGWTITGNPNIEMFSASTFTPPAGSAPGTQFVDLGVSQDFFVPDLGTTVGTTYTVSFDYAGNPTAAGAEVLGFSIGQVAMSLNFDTTGHTVTNMGWVHESIPFTPTASPAMLFFARGAGAADFVITNVSVVEVPVAGGPLVDWPIALVSLLALAALLGVGLIIRRRGSARAL